MVGEDKKNEEEMLKAFDKALTEIAEQIFTKSQDNLLIVMPFGESKRPRGRRPSIISNSGDLFRSGEVDTSKFLEKTITYSAPYATAVEFGSEPHNIPAEELVDWARKKLGKSERQARTIAYKVSATIAEYGTDPHPFLRPSIDAVVRKRSLKK